MEEWKEYKLGDVCDLIPGFAFKSVDFGNYCTKVIKIKDIQPPFVDTDGAEGINIAKYDVNKLSKFVVKKGDFILAMTGATIGKIGRYIDETPAFLNQRVLRFSPKDIVDFDFVYYYLSTKHFQTYIINHVDSESAQPNISGNTISKYPVYLPNRVIQERISTILKSFDDKIENNRRINENLEAQAQALFKSWFVDFEPFKDGEFVESELGMIPKGWRVGKLGEICIQSNIKVGNRNDVKVLSPVTTGQLMLSEEYFTKQVYSESIAKYKVVNKGAFAYNPARVNIGSLGRNEYDFDGAVSPVYVVFECKEGYSNFFDLFRTSERFKTEVLSRAIGGVRQSLNFVDFAMIQTIIAPQNVVDAFNPMFERIKGIQKHIESENESLSSLRDTLLPRLMSGELKVNEIE